MSHTIAKLASCCSLYARAKHIRLRGLAEGIRERHTLWLSAAADLTKQHSVA